MRTRDLNNGTDYINVMFGIFIIFRQVKLIKQIEVNGQTFILIFDGKSIH